MWYIFDLIGSSLPIVIICYCISMLMKAKKVNARLLVAYVFIICIMFFLLLRT